MLIKSALYDIFISRNEVLYEKCLSNYVIGMDKVKRIVLKQMALGDIPISLRLSVILLVNIHNFLTKKLQKFARIIPELYD